MLTAMPFEKYRPFQPVRLTDRRWPNAVIDRAPQWCSVDLRDGNQALIEPMSPEAKRKMFLLLVEMGFKEIEVGFPAASQTDFDFLRMLIDDKLIPADVTIQVLTQSRESLIRRTFEAIDGAKKVVVHLYNSTSELQRRVVFGMSRAEITEIAIAGTQLIRELAATVPDSEIILQYSPESFTGTELDFAVEITEAVMAVWEPTPQKKMIVNLPATVEMASPNVYADQIEWFCRTVKNRESILISLHPHNDRGTAVAAAEMGIMAGADRVEGTLFGNGERTGNVDVITLAMNMVSQGVDSGLKMSDINRIITVSEECTQLPVPARHPYAGALVFTAFSGSHQDAIKKGMAALRTSGANQWEVPYLPIDPADLGRSYEAVIRINSQSGKGGIAWVLEQAFGFVLPRAVQVEFAKVVQAQADASGKELSPEAIRDLFQTTYLQTSGAVQMLGHSIDHPEGSPCAFTGTVQVRGQAQRISGQGNGPVDAFVAALRGASIAVHIASYSEHAIGQGADSQAAAYVEIAGGLCGVGVHDDIVEAAFAAVLCAVNRRMARQG